MCICSHLLGSTQSDMVRSAQYLLMDGTGVHRVSLPKAIQVVKEDWERTLGIMWL